MVRFSPPSLEIDLPKDHIVLSYKDWLGSRGVDVCYDTSKPCNHKTNTIKTIDTYAYECVDLAARLYYKVGYNNFRWSDGTPIGAAKDLVNAEQLQAPPGGSLLWAQSAGALPLGRPQAAPTAASTGAIAYQGRLADANGNPLTGTYNMIFRLYAVPTGGAPLWEEQWTGSNGVRVSDGLFNVMLGSLHAIEQSVIAGHDRLWLGITVGTDDEMQPRMQLGSVPFAVQALTVPDGSVTTAKIADGAVTQAKAPFAVQHFRGTTPDQFAKVSTGTYVVELTGGASTEVKDLDISPLGFTRTPVGIAQVVDSDRGGTTFARYTWDGSTATRARIVFFRPDGRAIPGGLIRFHLILWSD